MDKKSKVEAFNEAVKPIVCQNLEDVKAALTVFLRPPVTGEIKVSAEVKWQDRDVSGVDKVEGLSRDSSLYSLLVEGMDVVKKRLELTTKLQAAVQAADAEDELPTNNMVAWDVDHLRFRVDSLIERRLGGKRHGLRVRWSLEEGEYEFDPYTKKLYKVEE